MKELKQAVFFILLLIISSSPVIWPAGTTGKIAGTLTDKSTNEPLLGANIIIMGTSLGTVTDINGNFTILYVPPGTYSVKISYVGYNSVTINEIRVYIDQTSRIETSLSPQSIEVGEVTVFAEKELIKPDVATSVVAVSGGEIKNLPVANVSDVVGLQAGIRGFSIRGGSDDKILFMLNGVTLRDPRNNQPVTKIPLSSVKEVSVERGGFNAEYGQVQSGLVNVVTQEGGKRQYMGRFQFRIRPPAAKYWRGSSDIKDISDPMSYALRPFFDDAVAWTGTGNGEWDEYTRKQYPEFMGWNEVSRILNTDNDPDNDLTPTGAQRVFQYEVRKQQQNNQPDYDIDAGFGGPVPFVNEYLGDLRFFTSYRSTREMLIFPLTRPDYTDYDWTMQINSDITPSMRLRFSSLFGKQYTLRSNWDGTGFYSYIRYPNEVASAASSISGTADLITLFSDFNFALSDISHRSLATKFTHTLSPKTFYEVSLENFAVDYNTRPSSLRDTTQKVEVIPGYWMDANPFGYWPYEQENGVLIAGGQHVAKARDFSKVTTTSLKADFTSQINFSNLLKAGVEFNYNDLDFDYGTIASATSGQTYASRVQMRVFPIKAAMYMQNKLETEEFILNAGLRLDYSSSNSTWWNVDPYNVLFFTNKYKTNLEFPTEKTGSQWQLSPRLGIAHPITESAKLFFNYGHFKQVPNYESMFRLQRSDKNDLNSIGDPNLILAKTISYELGFDYSVSDLLLLQLAAYYNDVTDQQSYTTYNSGGSDITYSLTTANNYSDTRGLEVTLRKTIGRWWSGFINYTYQVTTSGHFGSAQMYDNSKDQKNYDDNTENFYQDRPIPQPYARANVSFYTPDDFGPAILGHHIFGNFMLNILADWQDGYWTTWNPKGLANTEYNVQSVDYINTNLRFDKTFDVGRFSFDLFVDVNNLFDTKRLWNTGDQAYLQSLHLPRSKAYDNIPGDDKVGDYREPGTEYQPMEYQKVIDPTKAGKERAIYYEGSTGKYFEYKNEAWGEVDQARIDKVLEDKAYIDMPNASTFWFLNPRNLYFGIRVSFNIFD